MQACNNGICKTGYILNSGLTIAIIAGYTSVMLVMLRAKQSFL
jgi:hypothetical protein